MDSSGCGGSNGRIQQNGLYTPPALRSTVGDVVVGVSDDTAGPGVEVTGGSDHNRHKWALVPTLEPRDAPPRMRCMARARFQTSAGVRTAPRTPPIME